MVFTMLLYLFLFMTKIKKLENANCKESQNHELRLIAVAPLPCMESTSSDDNDSSIATQFNSQHHVNFMEEVLLDNLPLGR